VLAPISGKYSLVYAWSASDGRWLKYAPTVGFGNTLVTLDETMGIWIKMTEAAGLTVNGDSPGTSHISLKNGWNLVGYPSATAKDLPAVMGAAAFTHIFSYHASDLTDPWKMYDTGAPAYANDLKALASGWGYWVHLSSDFPWDVDY
jgi:hypothetical protein